MNAAAALLAAACHPDTWLAGWAVGWVMGLVASITAAALVAAWGLRQGGRGGPTTRKE